MVPLKSVPVLVAAKLAMFIFFRADSAYALDGVYLQGYRQENSHTFCKKGLIHMEDQTMFEAEVDVTKFNNTLRSVSFLIRRETRAYYKHICFVRIASCGRKTLITNECHCKRTDKKDTYVFVLKMTALEIYSRGFLKVEVMLKNLSVLATDTVRLPAIFDPSYVWSSFLVNNELMSDRHCRANVNSSLVKLEYTCDIDWPSPCWLEITDASTNDTILHGSDSINRVFFLKNDTNLILKKRYCNSSYEHISYCFLTLDVQKEQVNEIPSSIDHTVLICVSSLSVVLLVIGVVIAFLCWRNKGKNTRTKGKSTVNMEELNTINIAESQSPELEEETEIDTINIAECQSPELEEETEIDTINIAESQSPELEEETEIDTINIAESQSPELETQSFDDVEEVTD